MRKLGLNLLVICIATSLRRRTRCLRRFRQQGRGHPDGQLRLVPRLPGPGALLHAGRLDGDVQHLPAAAHLRARQRRRGRRGRPGSRRGPARDQQRRQDLHAEAAQGARILRRHPGQGLRLRQLDREAVQDQLARLGLLRRHRRRGKIRRNQDRWHPRDQDQRQDRGDRHRPHRAPGNLLQRAGHAVRGAAAVRHPGQEPHVQPAPRHRPLRDRQVRSRPRLELRAQPGLGQEQRPADARPRGRQLRQDRDHRRPQRLDPGQRNRTGPDRLDADPAAGRPLRGSQGQIRGDPVPGREPDQPLLLLDGHDEGPLR